MNVAFCAPGRFHRKRCGQRWLRRPDRGRVRGPRVAHNARRRACLPTIQRTASRWGGARCSPEVAGMGRRMFAGLALIAMVPALTGCRHHLRNWPLLAVAEGAAATTIALVDDAAPRAVAPA